MAKPKVATASLAGCFGCHMSVLDIDARILKLVELVDFNKSPINDIKKFTARCAVGLVEGGCCNEENVRVLQDFRRNCDVLISVGECAIMGGVPAMRNNIPLRECLEEAYLRSPASTTPAGSSPTIPRSRSSSTASIPATRWSRSIASFRAAPLPPTPSGTRSSRC
jgi:coenzyme F420-reducing hydrogenase gamma subunit